MVWCTPARRRMSCPACRTSNKLNGTVQGPFFAENCKCIKKWVSPDPFTLLSFVCQQTEQRSNILSSRGLETRVTGLVFLGMTHAFVVCRKRASLAVQWDSCCTAAALVLQSLASGVSGLERSEWRPFAERRTFIKHRLQRGTADES